MAARVYITGAAGSGTSRLGQALAARLAVPHLDTDDFFWAAAQPPFTRKRPVDERLALLSAAQVAQGPDGGWVLSGAVEGWGDLAVADADLIVFTVTPTPIRLMRLRRRETAKFGDRIAPGGDMRRNHLDFMKWAEAYDDPYSRGRSLQRHRDWLAGQRAPVLEVSGMAPLDELVEACLARLGATG